MSNTSTPVSRTCPKCGKTYTEFPALSRRDNETLICPDCGNAEALEDYEAFTSAVSEDKQRIAELVNLLNRASDAYYNGGPELMSDFEYDRLFDEMKALEEKTRIILPDSPTRNVGATVPGPTADGGKLKKVRHKYPALSLDKTKDIELLIRKFAKAEEAASSFPEYRGYGVTVSPKMDGGSILLSFKGSGSGESRLVSAVSRGDGYTGNDVTHNVANIAGIPTKINYSGDLIVRGEVVMSYDEFNRVNSSLPEEERYSNPRNLANSALNMPDSRAAAERGHLKFFAFELVDFERTPELDGMPPEQYPWPYGPSAPGEFLEAFDEQLYWLVSLGFNVVPFSSTNAYSLNSQIRYWTDFCKNWDYPTDGEVFVLNCRRYAKAQQGNSHAPHFTVGYALKWADDTYETVLRNIEWSGTRTGLLSPVAVFDTVNDGEVDISRCTLNNVSYIMEHDLKIGDRITIYRANMVIPALADNLDKRPDGWDGESVTDEDIDIHHMPKVCPDCGGPVCYERNPESGSIVARCGNPACGAKLLGKLVHFCERDCMNIEGISESTLATLVENDWVKCFSDLYMLPRKMPVLNTLRALPGWGEKKVDNLVMNIEKSRKTNFVAFLHALGIPNVGKGQARLIQPFLESRLSEGKPLFPEFFELARCNYDWTVIPGIGPVISESINSWAGQFLTADRMFTDQNSDLFRLLQEINFVEEPRTKAAAEEGNNAISGKIFVVTGKIAKFPNRDALHDKIRELGGTAAGSVTKNTDYLICNEASESSKSVKARSLGVKVITEDEFLALAGIAE